MDLSFNDLTMFGTGPYGNLHKDIEMRSSSVDGNGLFAKALIKKGTILWKNREDGPMQQHYKLYTFDELDNLPTHIRSCITKYGSQLSDNTIIGPETENDAKYDNANYFNHSCDPNCLPLNENIWIAIKDINKDEEITIDYITFDSNPYCSIEKCCCNSKNCRKSLNHDDYKIPELQKKYKGHFVSFIQEKINSL
mgnify:CR=1 FL=1